MANATPNTSPEPAGSTRPSVVAELQDRLRKAEAVLRSLHEAKREADEQARRLKRTDAMKAVTGSSAIDRAISATTRMIERLKREVSEAGRVLGVAEVNTLDPGRLSLVG